MTKHSRIRGEHKYGKWCLSDKGYPRFTTGKYRHKYVHRVIMAKKLGRRLRKDEEVHHRDNNKLNFNPRNLRIISSAQHGWLSAKQHWFMRRKLAHEEQQWASYFKDTDFRFGKNKERNSEHQQFYSQQTGPRVIHSQCAGD